MSDTFLASLAGLPNWALYGLVGGILGALGGLIGALLAKHTGFKRSPQVLAVVGAVLSYQLTKNLILPAATVASMNVDLPKQIDDVTTLLKVEFQQKRFAYYYRLADSLEQTMSVDELKGGLLPALCKNWSPHFKSGQVVGVEYHYELRQSAFSFAAEPADCP
ncbi:MAG: hypothetical protein ACK4U0_09445 [Mesorhizobium sp.]